MPAGRQLQRTEVVTAFLRHDGRILLLRRSRRVGSYQGRWAGVSGYLEDPTPLQQALREVREETGLQDNDVRLVSAGKPLEVPAPELGKLWVVHPFLFDITDPEAIRLDWENIEARWVLSGEVAALPGVPALAEALATVLGS
jgi:8-oxo-dGTP pyrophosphatase MutT (NUDIX family)